MLYDQLPTKAQGDESKVKRLLDYERRRTPNADDLEILEAAIERWVRDYG